MASQEGELIGEEDGKYLIEWKDSFIPKGYASVAMVKTWEENNAKILAGGGKGESTKLKQPATIKGRVEKRGTGRGGQGQQ